MLGPKSLVLGCLSGHDWPVAIVRIMCDVERGALVAEATAKAARLDLDALTIGELTELLSFLTPFERRVAARAEYQRAPRLRAV